MAIAIWSILLLFACVGTIVDDDDLEVENFMRRLCLSNENRVSWIRCSIYLYIHTCVRIHGLQSWLSNWLWAQPQIELMKANIFKQTNDVGIESKSITLQSFACWNAFARCYFPCGKLSLFVFRAQDNFRARANFSHGFLLNYSLGRRRRNLFPPDPEPDYTFLLHNFFVRRTYNTRSDTKLALCLDIQPQSIIFAYHFLMNYFIDLMSDVMLLITLISRMEV